MKITLIKTRKAVSGLMLGLILMAASASNALSVEGDNLIVAGVAPVDVGVAATVWTTTTGFAAFQGSGFSSLWANPAGGYIQQDVSTVVGAEHTLTFDWNAYGYFGAGTSYIRARVYDAGSGAIIADSGLMNTYAGYATFATWTPRSLTFTPTGPNIRVRFTGNYGVTGATNFRYAVCSLVTNIVLTYEPLNNPPTANAGGDQSIRAGDTVNLDGGASFDDNTASASLLYSWSFSSFAGALEPTLTGANTATPSFVADAAGSYIVELVVTDEGALESPADQVEVSSDNMAPTANAGSDQLVIIGTLTALDGSLSSDPEGDALSYNWSLLSAPLGSSTVLIGANTATPDLTPDIPGTYAVTLIVSDFLGAGVTDQVDVVATTGAGYAEIQIMSADAIVTGLTGSQVTNGGNQQALGNLLSNAIKSINKANTETDPVKAANEIAKAIQKLNDAIERTDGCYNWGSPDDQGNSKARDKPQIDWITDCTAQDDVYALLQDAVWALTP